MPEGNAAEQINPGKIEKTPEKSKSPEDLYSERYWKNIKPEEKVGTEKAMEENLEKSLKEGKLDLSTSGKNLSEEDSEKIFAYSKFAKKQGYKIGPFEQDESGEKVSAKLSKGNEKVSILKEYRDKIFGPRKEKISDFVGHKKEDPKKVRGSAVKSLDENIKGWKEKYDGLKISAKDVWSKVEKRKILGQNIKTFAGSMVLSSGVRYAVKTATGLSGGIIVGASSGAIYGASLEAYKAYNAKSEKMEEFFAKKEELYKKAEVIGSEKNLNIKEKLDKYFNLVEIEKEVGMAEGKHKLAAEILTLFGESTRKKEMMRGAIKGSLVGGLGGAVGGVVGDYLSDYFHGPKTAHASSPAFTKIEEQVTDAYTKTFDSLRIEAVEGLDAKDFSIKAQKGDGLTNIARNMIHDYIAEKKALGVDISLDKSQLIYAEDSLKNMFGGRALNVDDVLSLKGENIASAIEKAQLLTDAGKAHLETEFADKINFHEWDRVTDYGFDFEPKNHYSEAITKEISDKATITVNDLSESFAADVAQKMRDKYGDKAASKIIELGKNRWLEDLFAATGVVLSVERAEAVKEKTRERYSEPKKKEEEEKKYIELREEDAIENVDEGLHRDVSVSDEYRDEFKKEKKGLAKALEIKEKTFNNPKFTRDPLYKFLKKRRTPKIFPGALEYVVAKKSGNTEGFIKLDNFYELNEYFNKLSEEDKDWLKERDKNGKHHGIFIKMPPMLRDFIANDPTRKKIFDRQAEIFIRKVLGDTDIVPKLNEETSSREERILTPKIVEEIQHEEEIRGSEIGNEYPYSKRETKIRNEQKNLETSSHVRVTEYDKFTSDGDLLKYRSATPEILERKEEKAPEYNNTRRDLEILKFSEPYYRNRYEKMSTEELGLEIGKINVEREAAIHGKKEEVQNPENTISGGKSIFQRRLEIIGEIFNERKNATRKK